MGRDIIFKTDDYVFSYRAAGLLLYNGKVLLQRPVNGTDYAIPGGHVALGETNEETLVREFKEEIDADIEVGELKWVGELFFPWGNRTCHQICLYYIVSLADKECIPLVGSFHGKEMLEEDTFKLVFSWIDVKDIEDIELYPVEAKAYLAEGLSKAEHFVYKEDVV